MNNFLKLFINGTRNKLLFILVLFLVLPIFYAFSQSQQPKPTRQSALDAFSKANFELAFNQFNVLSASYPRDPLYKYYCGVSLVKLERDPVKASTFLMEAQQGSAAIRTIPSDGLFYLGRAQQLSGNFGEAIESYNLYTVRVGKKAAKEVLTPQYIQQCMGKKGAIVQAKLISKEIVKKDSIPPVVNKKVELAEKIENQNPDTINKAGKSIPPEYEKVLNEALNYQFRADSLMKMAALYRMQYENAPVEEKTALKVKITQVEMLAGVQQKLANEKIIEAENLTKPVTGQVPLQEKKIKSDSISAQKADNQIHKDTVNQLVTKEKFVPAQPAAMELYSVFKVVVNPVYSANEKVTVNPDVPAGLIYRIQVAVFKNLVGPSYFKGITPVYGFKGVGSDLANYYAGMFRKSADASKALVKVKAAGFKDAFVVAFLDKKIVSAERAGILEKEWGNKPFTGIEDRKSKDAPRDTIPPTLTFRVEVTRSLKPLVNEQLDNIKRLAGNRGLDIIKNESGQSIYLIGKFINFASAAEYADLLIRNGQKEAKVTAYIGSKEIPVETAKQLFEKY